MRLPTTFGLEVKLVAALVLLVAASIGYLTWEKHVFNEGKAAQLAEDQKNLEINQKIFGDTQIRVDWVGNLASAEKIRLQKVTIHEVQTVEHVVHDHPEMGTWYRPDELERLRVDSLAQVRAAADASAAAAAGRAASMRRPSSGAAEDPAGGH